MQEGAVADGAERVYSVKLDCKGANLTAFPAAPRHTREVDLSDNKVRT